MTRTFRFAVLLCLAAGQAYAQAPAQPSAARCDALLTATEVSAIVGDAFSGPEVDEPRPGFTRCDWHSDTGNFGFTFASLKALADDRRTADQEFEYEVSALENDTNKRELLAGIGVKASILSGGDDALVVAVQRADGVARMITYKVDREKALALARAIAEP